MNIYLVGGAVRDELLGRKIKERDFVVTGATPEEMTAQGFKQVGKDFPVFLHPQTKEEYALARTERKHGQGYTGFICDFAPDITLEQDLLRRDLTINAIAKDATGKLIDPYNGRADLERRLLRHVSDAFSEDPLRVLRVARFAARYAYLGFSIAEETLTLMHNMVAAGELDSLTPERVWLEWSKSFEDGAFDVFLSVLKRVGALKVTSEALDKACNKNYLLALRQRLDFATNRDADTALKLVQVTAPLTESELESFSHKLRLSNDIRNLQQRFHRYVPLFEQDIGAAELLACFNDTDLWRRPEQFFQLLEAVTIYRLGSIDRELFERAAQAANKVDAKDCIADGITGAAIKDAMTERRLTAIASMMDQ